MFFLNGSRSTLPSISKTTRSTINKIGRQLEDDILSSKYNFKFIGSFLRKKSYFEFSRAQIRPPRRHRVLRTIFAEKVNDLIRTIFFQVDFLGTNVH